MFCQVFEEVLNPCFTLLNYQLLGNSPTGENFQVVSSHSNQMFGKSNPGIIFSQKNGSISSTLPPNLQKSWHFIILPQNQSKNLQTVFMSWKPSIGFFFHVIEPRLVVDLKKPEKKKLPSFSEYPRKPTWREAWTKYSKELISGWLQMEPSQRRM